MAFLSEKQGEKKHGEHGQHDVVDQARQAFEEAVNGPYFEIAVQVVGISQAQLVVGKEAGIGLGPKWLVEAPDDQGKGGFGGRDVEFVEAGNRLKTLGGIAVWSLGWDLFAVCKDIQGKRAGSHLDILRHWQLNEKCDRHVVRSQLEMETEPNKGAMVSFGRAGISVLAWFASRIEIAFHVIFAGNVGEEFTGIADCPG